MAKEWFLCDSCGYLQLTEEEAFSQHSKWGHLVKKRTPPHMRMVYSLGDEPSFTLDVDGAEWTVILRLLSFKRDKPERGSKTEKWRYFSSSVLGSSLREIAKKLSHIRPEISESELVELVKDSIRKGRFDEYSKQRCGISICLNSDVELLPKTAKSSWTTVTRSQLKSLVKGERETEAKSLQHAKRTRLT